MPVAAETDLIVVKLGPTEASLSLEPGQVVTIFAPLDLPRKESGEDKRTDLSIKTTREIQGFVRDFGDEVMQSVPGDINEFGNFPYQKDALAPVVESVREEKGSVGHVYRAILRGMPGSQEENADKAYIMAKKLKKSADSVFGEPDTDGYNLPNLASTPK